MEIPGSPRSSPCAHRPSEPHIIPHHSPRLSRPSSPRTPRQLAHHPLAQGSPKPVRAANNSRLNSPIIAKRINRNNNESSILRIANMVPADTGYFVYLICLLHGMAIFTPWTMFATVNEFYFLEHKLSPEYLNLTITPEFELRIWQNTFAPKMAAVAVGAHLIFAIANCLLSLGNGKLALRVSASLLCLIVCFLVNIFMTVTDTSEAFNFFLYVSMSIQLLVNISLGIYHSSIWAIISHLPWKYGNALLLGNNLIGFISALFILTVKVVEPEVKATTAGYFLTGAIVLLLAVGTYFGLSLKRFYRYHVQHLEIIEHQHTDHILVSFQTFKEHWFNYLDIFATYFVTYLIFPNVAMYINTNELFGLDESLARIVYSYLMFAFFATVGNFAANFTNLPGPRYYWVIALGRLLFIPFFLAMNYQRDGFDSRFEPIIASGAVLWIMMILFGLSHGYTSSMTMLNANRYGTKASMISIIFMSFGIALGLAGSLLFEKILIS